VLVYLTAHIGYPKDEIDASVSDWQKSSPGSPEPTIYWLSWRELPRLFCGHEDKHLADIARLADRLNLAFFEGFTSEVSPICIDWVFSDTLSSSSSVP